MKQIIEVRHSITEKPTAEQQAPGITDQEVWLSAWLAVAGAPDCKDAKVPTSWADKALASFKERFPE